MTNQDAEQAQQWTVFGDGRDINEDNEEIPEWARPYIRTLKMQVNSLQAALMAAEGEAERYREVLEELVDSVKQSGFFKYPDGEDFGEVKRAQAALDSVQPRTEATT